MTVPIFLFSVLGLGLVVAGLEFRAWLKDPQHLITTLSRQRPWLEALIESVFLLLLFWWPWHVATGR